MNPGSDAGPDAIHYIYLAEGVFERISGWPSVRTNTWPMWSQASIRFHIPESSSRSVSREGVIAADESSGMKFECKDNNLGEIWIYFDVVSRCKTGGNAPVGFAEIASAP